MVGGHTPSTDHLEEGAIGMEPLEFAQLNVNYGQLVRSPGFCDWVTLLLCVLG